MKILLSDASMERPLAMQFAVALLFVAAALSALVLVTSLLGIGPVPADVPNISTVVITLVFLLVTAIGIRAGRNWARWLLLIMVIFGSLFMLMDAVVSPEIYLSMSIDSLLSALSQTILQIGATVLVFSRRSRAWFAAVQGSKNAKL